MKKIISLLLCAVMLLIPMTVCAAEETHVLMGDITLDGKISAADARRVLRMSALVESSEGVNLLSADADGNGKLTAADARLILRKSAGLGELTCGFDANGIPNSFRAIKSNTFILGVAYDDVTFTIVKKGENIYVLGADPDGSMAQMGMEDCGIMFNDGNLYMTYKNKGKDIAMYIPDSLYDSMGISLDDIRNLADGVAMFLPEDPGVPEKQTADGKTVYVYNIDTDEMKCRITTDAYGVLRTIDNLGENGEVIDTVVVTKVNAQVDSSYFNMDKFEII